MSMIGTQAEGLREYVAHLTPPPKSHDALVSAQRGNAQQGIASAEWLESNLGKYECVYCGKVQQDQHVSCCGEVHFNLIGG